MGHKGPHIIILPGSGRRAGRGVAFPPLVLNKRHGDRLVSYPATHPILQLALVQMFDDDIYSTFLLGYFSMDGAYLST